MQDSFKTKARLKVGSTNYTIYSLKALEKKFPRVKKLPFSLRILLENLLRYEDGRSVTAQDIESLATRDVKTPNDREIAFRPARVLLQDFTGVPAVVDLATMREVDDGGHSREVLQEDAGWAEGDLAGVRRLHVAGRECLDVLCRDGAAVLVAEEGLEEDPERERELLDPGKLFLESLEAVNRVVRRPDLQAGLRLEAVLHVSSGSPAGTGGRSILGATRRRPR